MQMLSDLQDLGQNVTGNSIQQRRDIVSKTAYAVGCYCAMTSCRQQLSHVIQGEVVLMRPNTNFSASSCTRYERYRSYAGFLGDELLSLCAFK